MTHRRRETDQPAPRRDRAHIKAIVIAASVIAALSFGFGAATITLRAENNCNAIIDLRNDIVEVLRDAQDPDDSAEFFDRSIQRISAPDCP